MKRTDLAIYAILIVIIGIAAYTIIGFINEDNVISPNKGEQQRLELSTISTGSTGSGDVAIDLTPIEMRDGNLIVNAALNTHSVDLSQFDLKRIATLEYNGKIMYPIEAPEIEGHHSSGRIIFKIDGELKYFKITIKGIPKIEERMYEWG